MLTDSGLPDGAVTDKEPAHSCLRFLQRHSGVLEPSTRRAVEIELSLYKPSRYEIPDRPTFAFHRRSRDPGKTTWLQTSLRECHVSNASGVSKRSGFRPARAAHTSAELVLFDSGP